MKKVVILFVAVMLALPAMSFAGSATSRWDLTIGGMVKLDYFYADQSSNQDITYAERQSYRLQHVLPGQVRRHELGRGRVKAQLPRQRA